MVTERHATSKPARLPNARIAAGNTGQNVLARTKPYVMALNHRSPGVRLAAARLERQQHLATTTAVAVIVAAATAVPLRCPLLRTCTVCTAKPHRSSNL